MRHCLSALRVQETELNVHRRRKGTNIDETIPSCLKGASWFHSNETNEKKTKGRVTHAYTQSIVVSASKMPTPSPRYYYFGHKENVERSLIECQLSTTFHLNILDFRLIVSEKIRFEVSSESGIEQNWIGRAPESFHFLNNNCRLPFTRQHFDEIARLVEPMTGKVPI